MDGIRTFRSFQKQTVTRTQKRAPKKNSKKAVSNSGASDDLRGGRPSMVVRDLSEKPRIARTEILKKLEDNNRTKFVPKNVKGKKLGFESESSTASDVGLNNPDDPMTSEKLKSVLQSGAVNFNGKEKEILGKILNG